MAKLILDATCTPADITYLNDLGILNQGRVQIEKILDSLYLTEFIELEKTEHGAKKEELELVAHL